jgi:hypothetical protein
MEPEYEIDSLVELEIEGQDVTGTVTGINYVCPIYMYVIQLDDPIETEFGNQTGLYVPENILYGCPDANEITQWVEVGSYVFTYDVEGEFDEKVIDVHVKIGSDAEESDWYVFSDDCRDGLRPLTFKPFNKDDASLFAKLHIEENHEADRGENAEQYQARMKEESHA